jgi:hypothetical protein
MRCDAVLRLVWIVYVMLPALECALGVRWRLPTPYPLSLRTALVWSVLTSALTLIGALLNVASLPYCDGGVGFAPRLIPVLVGVFHLGFLLTVSVSGRLRGWYDRRRI